MKRVETKSLVIAVVVMALTAAAAVGAGQQAGSASKTGSQKAEEAQKSSSLPLKLLRAWSSSNVTVHGLNAETASVESTPPATLIAVAISIGSPFRIKSSRAVFDSDGRCCAGLSVILDDSRRINSWEIRLVTANGTVLDPVGVVVLDGMAWIGARTLVARKVQTNANLEEIFASASDAPKLLFLYKLKGSAVGLKWKVGDGEPRAVQLELN